MTTDSNHGDDAAIAGRSYDVQRFTKADHDAGATNGWRFLSGWHRRASGLQWAWFERMTDGKTQTDT